MLEQILEKHRTQPRILHVDNDEEHLMLTKIYLENAFPQIMIDSTKSSHEALMMIQEKEYDCIVIEYLMPEMDGLELSKKIKEDRDAPIIIYNGKTNGNVLEKAFQIEIEDYVEKLTDLNHYNILSQKIIHLIKQYNKIKVLKKEINLYKNFLDLYDNIHYILDNNYKILWTNSDIDKENTNFKDLYPNIMDVIKNADNNVIYGKEINMKNKGKLLLYYSSMKDGFGVTLKLID